MQEFVGLSKEAYVQEPRVIALSLLNSTDEYCPPMWLNSAYVGSINVQLNEAMIR